MAETQERIQAIKDLADEIGGKARGYSGRGMYGAECWAISCDDADDVIERCREYGLRRPRVDQLGRGNVCYWPSVAYVFETEKGGA